jgi:hypothetical protein
LRNNRVKFTKGSEKVQSKWNGWVSARVKEGKLVQLDPVTNAIKRVKKDSKKLTQTMPSNKTGPVRQKTQATSTTKTDVNISKNMANFFRGLIANS